MPNETVEEGGDIKDIEVKDGAAHCQEPEISAEQKVEHKEQVIEHLVYLLDNQQLTDVTLVVNERTYAAHRLVLAARSQVFRTMLLSTHWKDSGQEQIVLEEEESVGLPHDGAAGPTLDVFGAFLRYLYDGRVLLTVANAAAFYALANKYDIAELMEDTHQFMRQRVQVGVAPEYVLHWWHLGLLHDNLHMVHCCERFILHNYQNAYRFATTSSGSHADAGTLEWVMRSKKAAPTQPYSETRHADPIYVNGQPWYLCRDVGSGRPIVQNFSPSTVTDKLLLSLDARGPRPLLPNSHGGGGGPRESAAAPCSGAPPDRVEAPTPEVEVKVVTLQKAALSERTTTYTQVHDVDTVQCGPQDIDVALPDALVASMKNPSPASTCTTAPLPSSGAAPGLGYAPRAPSPVGVKTLYYLVLIPRHL